MYTSLSHNFASCPAPRETPCRVPILFMCLNPCKFKPETLSPAYKGAGTAHQNGLSYKSQKHAGCRMPLNCKQHPETLTFKPPHSTVILTGPLLSPRLQRTPLLRRKAGEHPEAEWGGCLCVDGAIPWGERGGGLTGEAFGFKNYVIGGHAGS